MKTIRSIPKFNSELEEFKFWRQLDSMDLVDREQTKQGNFPNLTQTSNAITLNLPPDLLEKIKIRANKIDVPFVSLVKMYILKAFNDNTTYHKKWF
jgi:predicted DNA binding CopG/RHH family protein